jgi:hypothetical protein
MKKSGRVRVVVSVLATCLFILGLWSGALAADKSDQMRARQVEVEAKEIKNENPEFVIKLWAEGEKDNYKINDTVSFMFTANKDCYVTLINIATDGTVHQIFPNKWHKEGKVEKGKTYTIPPKEADFVFRVKGPEGTEYIKAIATLDPLKSVSQVKEDPKEEYQKIEEPETVMRNIKVELKQKDTKNWTEALATFKIAAAEGEKK